MLFQFVIAEDHTFFLLLSIQFI